MAVGVVVVAGEAGRVITIALRVAAGRALMPMCTPSLLCIHLPRCRQLLPAGLMQHSLARASPVCERHGWSTTPVSYSCGVLGHFSHECPYGKGGPSTGM